MSSWLQKKNYVKEAKGYHQVSPSGTFIGKTIKPTVVSAYYEIPSKRPSKIYYERIHRLFSSLEANLIFFTDAKTYKEIKVYRENFATQTKFVILEFSELIASRNFTDEFWLLQKIKDLEPEHSVELYKIWFEKKEFVKRAIELNPFGSEDFIWLDAGILIDDTYIENMKTFPNSAKIPIERFLMLNVDPFEQKDEITHKNITGKFLMVNRIAGNILAASKNIWLQWSKKYDDILQKYIDAGRFIGKDQTIMATLVLENKNFVSLVNPKSQKNKWFYLIEYLS